MSGEFGGRTCAVTGGGAGIGAAICRAFAAEGAHVAVIDRDLARAEALARTLPDARAFACDVSQPEAVKRCFEAVGPVDVLVNNAGIVGGPEYRRNLERRVAQMEQIQRGEQPDPTNATAEMTDEVWRTMLAVHLDGTFYCTRAVLPFMQARRAGAIVNMGSVIGIDGGGGMPHYAAAKAAIHAFTRSVAQEVGPLGIRVNAVAPGYIATGMRDDLPEVIAVAHVRATPLGRLGTPEEIAEAVLFLASSRAAFITGQVLSANGGVLSR